MSISAFRKEIELRLELRRQELAKEASRPGWDDYGHEGRLEGCVAELEGVLTLLPLPGDGETDG